MVSPRPQHLVFLAIAAAATGVAAGGEPQEPAQRARVGTLELGVDRDKQVMPSDRHQLRQIEELYRTLAHQAITKRANLAVVPFRRHLEAQAHFIGRVCEFDEMRSAALAEQSHVIVRTAVDRFTEAMLAKRDYSVIMIDGVKTIIPSGINELFLRSPREAARQELDEAIAAKLSARDRARLNAEHEQAAIQAREADVLLHVALLDEALLLSTEQRNDFRELLAAKWTDAWRQPNAVEVFRQVTPPIGGDDSLRCPFHIPEVEMTARLRPAQVEIASGSCLDSTARTSGPNSTNGIFAGVSVSPTEEQMLAVLVDDVSVACDITDEQRSKLQLAGTMSIKRQHTSAEAKSGRHVPDQPRRTTPAARLALFSTTLADERSPYFKALTSNLTCEQRARLTAAHAERQRFHERAALADVVRKLSERIVLTMAQREQLQEFLVARLADTLDAEPALGPRLGQLHRIIAIRPIGREVAAGFREIFDDVQWPLACEVWKSLERDLISQESARVLPPAAVQERAADRGVLKQ